LPGDLVFVEKLEQFLTGLVFFEMKKYHCDEFLFECEFQRLVSS